MFRAMLEAAGPRTPQALQAWDLCLSELVRQVFVQCNDRGELLTNKASMRGVQYLKDEKFAQG